MKYVIIAAVNYIRKYHVRKRFIKFPHPRNLCNIPIKKNNNSRMVQDSSQHGKVPPPIIERAPRRYFGEMTMPCYYRTKNK